MCSSSTTLFNAAMRAGLQMGARSNHKYHIPRYPLGLDATVSKMPGGGGQTMLFTNHMKHPIAIRTYRYTAGGIGWVQYEIWGIPDGRTVTLSRPSVSGVVKATTRVEYVDSLPRGVREQTEYPSNRMDVLGDPGRASRRPDPPSRHVGVALRALERRDPGRPLTQRATALLAQR